MKTIYQLCLASIALVLWLVAACDRLPPRTPEKAARNISRLSIPSSGDVVYFEDEWSDFNGDGFSKIEIVLCEADFQKVRTEAIREGFVETATADSLRGFIRSIWQREPTGVLKIERDGEATTTRLLILDDDRRSVLIYFSSQ